MRRACLDCGTLIASGSRCARCQQPIDARRDLTRPAHARTSTPARIKRRDGGCVICGATETLEVHHRVPIANGGTHDDDNLITLCHAHHLTIHRYLKGH